MMKVNLKAKQVALIAIFAALYFILSLITPYVPAIGIPELKISLEALIATVFGIILGPYLGAAAAFIGAGIAWMYTGALPVNLPFLFSPPLNALASGFIFYNKWKISFGIFAVLIIAFLFTPPVQPLTEYWYIAIAVLFDKIIALLLIIPLVTLFKGRMSVGKTAGFFFLLSFIGNELDNMWGSLVFATPIVYETLFQMNTATVQGLFLISPFAYPAIRLIQAFIGMLILVPLIKTLQGTDWLWSKDNILSRATKKAQTSPPPLSNSQ
jgi:hypothetical protein